MKKQERVFDSTNVSLRAIEEGGKRYFTGYAAVFNQRSRLIAENNKVFYEYIERGAFDDVLQRQDLDVKLTFNHKKDMIMGRTKSGTLTLNVDEVGLFFRSEVPNTTLGNDTFEMVQRGDYPDCSFVFTIDKNRWERGTDNYPIHYVERVKGLYDVAICVDGAYEQTVVGVEYARAIDELTEEDSNEAAEREALIELENDQMKLDLMKIKN